MSAAMTADSSRAGTTTLSHGSVPPAARGTSARRPALASGRAIAAAISPPPSASVVAIRERGASHPTSAALAGSAIADARIPTEMPFDVATPGD